MVDHAVNTAWSTIGIVIGIAIGIAIAMVHHAINTALSTIAIAMELIDNAVDRRSAIAICRSSISTAMWYFSTCPLKIIFSY